MRRFLGVLAAAGMMALGAGTVSAQELDVQVGVGHHGPRAHVVREEYGRPAYRHRVIERRVVERPMHRRTVCKTVIREHVRPSGAVVRRPTEVCRSVVGGRRTYVD